MPALTSDIDGDEDNILDETESVGTDNSHGPDVCALLFPVHVEIEFNEQL
jgi:hypothetical protein